MNKRLDGTTQFILLGIDIWGDEDSLRGRNSNSLSNILKFHQWELSDCNTEVVLIFLVISPDLIYNI